MFRLLIVVTLFFGAQGAWNTNRVSSRAYPIETHNVTTKDGYILGLKRIPYGKNSRQSSAPKKVVLLMHGLTFGSNSFTYLGPKYAIAYNLADAGYDVWMGNARGNGFSRRHETLDPDTDKMKFYYFDYEDIAMKDLPATIDYILDKTGQKKLHYMGYSQGGSIFYALNSRSCEYHSKIASAHLLAGIGYQNNLPNTNIKIVSKSADIIYAVAVNSGIVEVVPSSFSVELLELLVGNKPPAEFIVGAGVRQFIHYLQNMRDERFGSFNNGITENAAEYGSIFPPKYNLSNINIDVTVHYSLGDITQSEEDALAMVKAMPRAKARKVARADFTHMDYLTSIDAKKYVTDYIIECLNNA